MLVTTTKDPLKSYDEVIAENDELKKRVTELATKISWYEEQIRLANHRRFGTSSEHAPVGQFALSFNEAEVTADPAVSEPDIEEVVTSRRKKTKGHRDRQLAQLEVREIEYPLSEDQMLCECCGEKMHLVDWQTTRKVGVTPAKAYEEIHKQPVVACRNCQAEGEPAPIKLVRTMPEQAFPKSIASPSLVSYFISQKFVMGNPLYRLEQNIQGLGLTISRQTMANWMMAGADLLDPIYNRMHEILITRDIVQADETKLQVIKEQGRSATTDSTMWLYRSGSLHSVIGPPVVLFDYQTTRAGYHAKEFLEGFGGYDPITNTIVVKKYLITDGHDGYDAVPKDILIENEKVPDVIRAGCWAHARRGFFDALKILKKEDRKSDRKPPAQTGLDYCDKLFKIEREIKDATPEERFSARKQRSEPILDEFKQWLDVQNLAALPKSKFGGAIKYCLNQWKKLIVFLQDGRIEIDNNRSERSIKPFVVGRKNWLFCFTPRGAKASAILYSIVETAKENELIPFEYLKYLFQRLPNINTDDKTAIDNLLPWSDAVPKDCRKTTSQTR